jgi:hypothetical protein
MFEREVEERQEHVEVLGDLGGGLFKRGELSAKTLVASSAPVRDSAP